MTETPERRRQRRVQLPEPFGRLVVSLDGKVLDISLSGMAVETQTRISPHRVLTLRLGDREQPIQLAGRVVWCFLHGTRTTPGGEQLPLYRAGIQFLDVLSPQSAELVRFLERHAIITLDSRLFGRFVVDDADPVEVSSSTVFQVAELDAEGLTVETASELELQSGCRVELQLGETQIEARTLVEQVTPPTPPSTSWSARLRFAGLEPATRQRLLDYLRSDSALDGGVPPSE